MRLEPAPAPAALLTRECGEIHAHQRTSKAIVVITNPAFETTWDRAVHARLGAAGSLRPMVTGSDGDRRWPRRVFGVGEEPDPRFSFANERTFLAWVRTSLAMLAAGIALHAFVEDVPDAARTAAALILVGVGVASCLLAYSRWMASERALRLGRPLPSAALVPALAYAVAGIWLLGVILVLLGG